MDNYKIANCTDVGRVRSVNEDSMAAFDSPNGEVVVVCDGMGGQNAGDVASQLAITVIQDILSDNTFNTPEEAINSSIIAANQAILRRAAQSPDLAGMGSTCVMVIINHGKVYYGSVGDSRIYYADNSGIRQITKDQSYVQTLVDAGQLTPEAAEHHRDKNQITNALGIEGMTPPVIGQMPIQPKPGSVFILCSDGLSGMISNNTIYATALQRSVPLAERAKRLVAEANNAGGSDNITVQLVEFPLSEDGNANLSGMHGNPQKPKPQLYAIIAAVAAVVILIGAGLFWFLGRNGDEAKPDPKQSVVKEQPSPHSPAIGPSPSRPLPSSDSQVTERKEVVYESGGSSTQSPKPKAVQKKASNKKAMNNAENAVVKSRGQKANKSTNDKIIKKEKNDNKVNNKVPDDVSKKGKDGKDKNFKTANFSDQK